MPTRHVYVEPEVVLTHQGVSVYRCYNNDDIEDPDPFVFSTNKLGTDTTCPDAFDIRDCQHLAAVHQMRAYPTRAAEFVSAALIEAIETKLIPLNH
jgi:hypothetical protein